MATAIAPWYYSILLVVIFLYMWTIGSAIKCTVSRILYKIFSLPGATLAIVGIIQSEVFVWSHELRATYLIHNNYMWFLMYNYSVASVWLAPSCLKSFELWWRFTVGLTYLKLVALNVVM